MIEVTIRIKDDSKSFTHKELVYDSITLSRTDSTLRALVEQAQKELKVDLVEPETTIKASMVW